MTAGIGACFQSHENTEQMEEQTDGEVEIVI